jgi:biopolymer transport protein TolR
VSAHLSARRRGRPGRLLRHAVATPRASAEINVTPLVDVVLVLLIIFMVVTPLLDKRLRVRLPDDEQEVTAPVPGQLVVGISRAGGFVLGGEPVADERFPERLRRALAARAPGDRMVFFAADDGAPYQRLVTALEAGRKAGAEVLALTTEPMAVP